MCPLKMLRLDSKSQMCTVVTYLDLKVWDGWDKILKSVLNQLYDGHLVRMPSGGISSEDAFFASEICTH